MSQEESYDIIVIGGGISGLSFANQVATKGKKVLLLESNDRIGGRLHTHYHKESDFWVEMGAHTFYASYTNLIHLIESNQMGDDIVAREKVGMKVFTDDHEKIFSKINKLELLTSGPKLFFSKRDNKTVKEYFGNIVGKKNYDKVFSRLFSAVIVQNADDFSAEFYLKKRKTKSKCHPKSFIFKEGMQHFIEGLAKQENITVCTNEEVNAIGQSDQFTVKTKSGKTFTAKDIALAVAPDLAGKLVEEIDSELSQVMQGYACKQITTKTVILSKEKIKFDPVSFIIPLQGECLAMVTRDVKTHENYRGFAFHFEENSKSAEEQKTFMAELLKVQEEDLGEIIEAKHQLPVLNLAHKERMPKVKELSQKKGIYLVGNYFNGLSIEDCAERAIQEAERYVKS